MSKPRSRKKTSVQIKPKTKFQNFFDSVIGKHKSVNFSNKDRVAIRGDFSESTAKRIFSKHAKTWNGLINKEVMEHELESLKQRVKINPSDSIVSVGSGTSILEAFLAKEIVPKGKVISIDIAHGMSKEAKKIKINSKANNLSILTASGTKIPLRSNSQNKVIAIQSNLLETRHWEPFLQESRRILKKEGSSRLVFSVVLARGSKLSVANKLQQYGFTPLELITLATFGKSEVVMFTAKPRLT